MDMKDQATIVFRRLTSGNFVGEVMGNSREAKDCRNNPNSQNCVVQ